MLSNQVHEARGAMSVAEFGRWACIGKTKIYAEVKAGRLTLRKIGTKTVILCSEAEQWLRSLPTAPVGGTEVRS
jgi:hypothetical protein